MAGNRETDVVQVLDLLAIVAQIFFVRILAQVTEADAVGFLGGLERNAFSKDLGNDDPAIVGLAGFVGAGEITAFALGFPDIRKVVA